MLELAACSNDMGERQLIRSPTLRQHAASSGTRRQISRRSHKLMMHGTFVAFTAICSRSRLEQGHLST